MKKYSKDKIDNIKFRCSSEFKFNLLMLAQSKGLTLTQLIVQAIENYLEKEGN